MPCSSIRSQVSRVENCRFECLQADHSRNRDISRIFSAEEGAQSLFEGATEQHCCPGVLLFPAVQIAMPIPARAGEVLADLGVAVGHHATCGLSRLVAGVDSSSHRLAGANPSKSEQGGAVENDVADFDHAAETDRALVIDFIAAEQFGIVAEVAQEPIKLPQGFGSAIETSGKSMAGKSTRLEDGKTKQVVTASARAVDTGLVARGPGTGHRECRIAVD